MQREPNEPTALSSRQRLAMEIRAFLERTGMRSTPFGLMAARDDKLLWRIENARYGISLDKADRIYAFMQCYDRSVDTGLPPEKALERAKSVAADPFDTGETGGFKSEMRQQKTQARRTRARSKAEVTAEA